MVLVRGWFLSFGENVAVVVMVEEEVGVSRWRHTKFCTLGDIGRGWGPGVLELLGRRGRIRRRRGR